MPNTNLTVGNKDPEETNFLTPVILDRRKRHQFSSVTQLCPTLSSPSPSAFNLSQHQGLSNKSALCIR